MNRLHSVQPTDSAMYKRLTTAILCSLFAGGVCAQTLGSGGFTVDGTTNPSHQVIRLTGTVPANVTVPAGATLELSLRDERDDIECVFNGINEGCVWLDWPDPSITPLFENSITLGQGQGAQVLHLRSVDSFGLRNPLPLTAQPDPPRL